MYALAAAYTGIALAKNTLFLLFVLLVTYLWCKLWDKQKHGKREALLAALLGIITLLYIYPGYMGRQYMGSSAAISFLQVLVAVLTIRAVAFINLQVADYVILTVTIFCMQNFSTLSYFPNSTLFLGGWFLLCIIAKRRYPSLKSMAAPILISYIAMQISYLFYGGILNYGVRRFYYDVSMQLGLTSWQKLLFLSMISLAFLLFMLVIVLLIKRILQVYLPNIKDFSEKYEEIGQYLLLVPVIFGAVLILLDAFTINSRIDTFSFNKWILILFVVCFLCMQLFYLKLMLKTVHLKEHLKYKEAEQMNLQLYNQDISRNMQEIREMKHDLKNVFLTMGEYVKRSNDEQLKEYYYEKIAPFAGNEIRMNDLYVALQELQNESLKAFLYYKLLQGMDSHIDMKLETKLDHTIFPYLSDISDIIRILGIFMDNAMEESVQIENGFVQVGIKEQEGQMSISVKNAVRESVIQKGIHIGTTNKGLGRGNGLSIVEKLVKKHNDILWNSYFQDGIYVQVISVMRENNPT